MYAQRSPTPREHGFERTDRWKTPIISGITHTTDEAYVTLTDVPDKPGTAASIFNAVAAAHINVDTIIQNAVTHGDADVTFSIPTRRPAADDATPSTASAATWACTGGSTTPRPR